MKAKSEIYQLFLQFYYSLDTIWEASRVFMIS